MCYICTLQMDVKVSITDTSPAGQHLASVQMARRNQLFEVYYILYIHKVYILLCAANPHDLHSLT
jgi:hypothetical protein